MHENHAIVPAAVTRATPRRRTRARATSLGMERVARGAGAGAADGGG